MGIMVGKPLNQREMEKRYRWGSSPAMGRGTVFEDALSCAYIDQGEEYTAQNPALYRIYTTYSVLHCTVALNDRDYSGSGDEVVPSSTSVSSVRR